MVRCPTCGKDEDDVSRQGDSFLIAENIDREIHIRKVKVEE